MRILQLAPIWETVPPPAYGGTEAVVSVLTEELVARGHEVTLAASGDSSTAAELMATFPRSLRPAGLSDEALQYAMVHVAFALRQAGDYDIVHSHTGPPSELAMAMSHLIDVPMLSTLHNQLQADSRFIWSSYSGWYNTISHQQRTTLPDLPRARFAGVVHNAIDVDSFPFNDHKDDYLLFLGRMVPEKGPHIAIEVARRLGRRLIMAGKIAMPVEKAYYSEVLAPMIDGKQVQFLGEADAVLKRQLYAGASAFLAPLQWDEPFGLVMIEAMACGTPAIVFNRGAASEIVVDGETGYLVQDAEEMAAAISKTDAIDPYRCRAHVEQRFSPGALADAYLAIYEQILSRKESRHDPVLV
jgi:glycosyltransferase involved in cell wall biosynthesis